MAARKNCPGGICGGTLNKKYNKINLKTITFEINSIPVGDAGISAKSRTK
ncbi:hypothetical protein [Chromobacterium sphagni]|nr:hypothetical protein [Chromobacterium sphagni]